MTTEIHSVGPEATLGDVARILDRNHISGIPVIAPSGRAVGVITQTDLIHPDGDKRSNGTAVADVMSPFVLCVPPGAPVLVAARLMLAENVHRLVVASSGRVVGIISAVDVLRAFVTQADADA